MVKKLSPLYVRAGRIALATVLVSVLVYAVDWRSIPTYLAGIDPSWAALAVAGLTVHFVVSPWKWQWALRIHRLDFDLPYLLRANGIGFFFNNFLPSAIGGDAYRIMSTWPTEGFRSRAVSAVVVERLVGLMALMTLGNLGALALLDASNIAQAFVVTSGVSAVLLLGILAALSSGAFARLTAKLRGVSVVEAVSHNFGLLSTAGHRWLPLIAISLLFQAIAIANIYALFRALGAPVDLASCAVIAAVSGLASILPISINGLGVVEGSFAATAVALGVDYEVALLVAVLIRLIVLPLSLFFGAVYAFGGGTALKVAKHARPS